MSEPLRKNKLFVLGGYDSELIELGETGDKENSVVKITELRSALEEFERLIKFWSTSEIVYLRVKDDLRKAFPAIYEKEDPRTTIVDPFPRRPKQ